MTAPQDAVTTAAGMGDGPFTLRQVAKMTGISLRWIELACRQGEIPFIPRGAGKERVHRVMYRMQVDALINTRRAQATATTTAPEPVTKPVDDLDEARAATRQRLTRRTGHRRAA